MDASKFYIFYDGDCGFCNFWVNWILKNDKKDLFLFASLQSDFGQNFLKERNIESNQFNTLYLWKPEKYYLTKSKAVAEIAKILGGKYAVLGYMNIFPKFLGDKIYDKISENRHKIKAFHCKIPTASEKKKFIV